MFHSLEQTPGVEPAFVFEPVRAEGDVVDVEPRELVLESRGRVESDARPNLTLKTMHFFHYRRSLFRGQEQVALPAPESVGRRRKLKCKEKPGMGVEGEGVDGSGRKRRGECEWG